MDIKELQSIFLNQQRLDAIKRAVDMRRRDPVTFCNMAGSSPALLLAAIKRPEPVIVVGDSLDDAGYLYHDLVRLLGEDAVLMFPSGYKRAVKYGQPDPPSQILRTEALSRWTAPATRIVVTYPEALAEKVSSRTDLDDHTLKLKVGTEVDIVETQKWLRVNGFTEVDYVYEPGQFASRGSILDIFGYSFELPYRVDFFGDEIDSIRTFNIETQLSEKKVQDVAITANVASETQGDSLLEFIPQSTLIAFRDTAYTI